MTFEEYTGKKVAVVSNSGYIYNHDKTKKTLNEDLAAAWYGCKKEDLVLIYPYSWTQSGVYLEPAEDYVNDKGEVLKRIKVSFWEIKNSQPVGDADPLQVTMLNATDPSTAASWRPAGVQRGEKYEPCFYVYSNGKVSHNDMILGQATNFKGEWRAIPELVAAYNKAEEKYVRPSKVKTNPTPSVIGYYDYPQNMVPLNNHFTDRGSCFDEPVIELLKSVGLDKYTHYDTEYKVRSYGALVDLMKYGVFETNRTAIVKTEEFLTEPSKDMGDNVVEIEKIGKGTMIRVADDAFKETRRIFITERGTVKIMFCDGGKDKEVWYSKDTSSTAWILDALCFAKHTGKLKGEVKDLISENPKFKYLNKWINENIDTLMGFNFAPDRRADNKWQGPKRWGCWYGSNSEHNTIVDFLRTANKYPALVETLAKLGYGDLFMQTEKIKYDKRDGFAPVWNSKDTTETKEVKTLAINRINTGYLGHNLKKGSKSMLECLGINKEQWKFLTKKIDEDVAAGMSKEIAVVRNFGFINTAEKYFTGQDSWGCFKKSTHNFIANELSEVQEAAFEKFYDAVKSMEQSKNIKKVIGRDWWNLSETRAYGEVIMDCILDSYTDDYNGRDWIRGDINHDTLLKVAKKCVEKDVRISDLSDYSRLRTQCAGLRIEGYNIEDWPAMPRPEYVPILHDRLTELYNAAQAKRQAEQETENQRLYDTRVDKLIKLEYENDEDDMAIVCPRKLIEIILEGQRLSHCVGSYTEAVANGVETILFLRKKDTKDKSYATIDIALNKVTKKWDIRQVHTACNGPITEEDAEFLRKWAKSRGVDENTVTTRYGALCHLAVE